jgi:hypothetical protein
MGVSLCPKEEDLKFCKNATSWNLPDADFKPLQLSNTDVDNEDKYVSCNHLKDEPNPQGQQIKISTNKDGHVFNCINRRDEDPFKENTAEVEVGAKKNWLDYVNEPCSKQLYQGRRCLGQRADLCVWARGKFPILHCKTGILHCNPCQGSTDFLQESPYEVILPLHALAVYRV